jgi:hypothetical protein
MRENRMHSAATRGKTCCVAPSSSAWWWIQTNRSAAAKIMSMAQRTGLSYSASQTWAVQLLPQASRLGAVEGSQVLHLAAVGVLERQVSSGVTAPAASDPAVQIQSVRGLAQRWHDLCAEQPQLAQFLRSSPGPLMAQVGRQTPTVAALDAPRSDVAVRLAYNQPTHWRVTAAGLMVPSASQLKGVSDQAWKAVIDKFGSDLSNILFNANVRGGLPAVFAAMNHEGSRQSLTPVDLARLSYVALTPGVGSGDPSGIFLLSLHDAGHCVAGYGPAELEENEGDQYAEFLLRSMYAHDPKSAVVAERKTKIAIDSARLLDVQPNAVAALAQEISVRFQANRIERLTAIVVARYFDVQRAEIKIYSPSVKWAENPASDAQTILRLLQPLTSHLGPTQQARIQALVGQHGWTAVDPNAGAPMLDNNPYQIKMFRWVRDQLAPAVAAEMRSHLMPWSQFQPRAQRMVAFGLLLERTSPGVLSRGPTGTGLDPAQLPAAVRTLDLRVAYPPVLREVERNLPVSPHALPRPLL